MGSFGFGGQTSKSSSSSQSQSRTLPPVSINPAQGVLANLFGVGTDVRRGGIQLTGEAPNFANQVFGPESFGALGDFVGTDILGDQPEEILSGAVEPGLGLIGAGQDTLRGLLETGLPVDVDPLVDQGIADVNERIAPLTGLFSTDIAREGARTSAQLRVGAEEQARGRQLSALPLTGAFAQAPSDFVASLLGTENQNLLQGTEAGRSLSLLQALAGITPTSAIVGQRASGSGEAQSKMFGSNTSGGFLS